MASHLSNGRVNLSTLRESYRRELLECLDRCTGSKALVWDDALTGPFGLIAEYSLLKEHEVDKMFSLRGERLPASQVQNIVFVVRPKVTLMDIVAQNVLKEDEQGGFRKEFHIFFVPRKSLICERRLKDLGVHGTFTNVDELCIDLIPYDNDVLCMGMDNCYRECHLEKDETSLFYIAKSLMTIQALYGIIPNVSGKGQCARRVADQMLRLRRELSGNEAHISPQIDRLLLIDRHTDPVTPLLTQLTYEGLVDEIYGIKNTSVKLPAEKFSNSEDGVSTSAESKKFILNSSEQLYSELRNKNFKAVGGVLNRTAKLITAQADERHAAKTVGQIKEFVSKLPHIQMAKASLATHTSIAELVKEVADSDDFMGCLWAQQELINGYEVEKAQSYIEDCIAKHEPLLTVLRLMCLQSLCGNGLKQKLLDYYKTEVIQVYGYEHILTIHNLEKVGLLKLQSSRPTYPTIRKSLKLIVEDVNEKNPGDISYVFSGYAPLSVRLAQYLHQPGWRGITEVLGLLPGPSFQEVQNLPSGFRKRRSSITSTSSNMTEPKVTLVFFIGGVTYAEISALRFLSQQEDGMTDYMIAATSIINGNSWIESLTDELQAQSTNPF